MEERIKKLEALLIKHGICEDCGEMYSHDLDAPFASCECKQAEWGKFTPYMQLQLELHTLTAENTALITALKNQSLSCTVLPDTEKLGLPPKAETSIDAMAAAVDNHIKLIAAKSWSNLEDTKGRAVVEAIEGLLRRYCPVSGHVIMDENSRKTIQEYADEFKPKCNHPECK